MPFSHWQAACSYHVCAPNSQIVLVTIFRLSTLNMGLIPEKKLFVLCGNLFFKVQSPIF